MSRTIFIAVFIIAGAAMASRAGGDETAGIEFFEKRIRPVLAAKCYACHAQGAKSVKSELLLDSRAAMRAGGESSSAIVPGKPEASLLLEALRYESLEMPPQGKLSDAIIADFAKWIKMGAPDPRNNDSTTTVKQQTDARHVPDHWAFQSPQQTTPPSVKNDAWPQNDIDRFVLRRLKEAGVKPAPRAEKKALLRRIYFDLIGLPPTPAETEAFVADDAAETFADVVDRLLQSRHFGERWGRHWMDVVRYADSTGGGGNVVFDNAWRYRDWIIRAFNEDKPYDRFLLEQIAGDLLPADTPKQKSNQIVATAFLALGRRELPEYDKLKLKLDVVDEQIDTLGKSLLGLSLGCARCHDHKFDPVSTEDYYALAGIFESTEVVRPPKGGPLSTWVVVDLPDKSGKALAVRDVSKPVDSRICVRGDVHRRDKQIPRGFVSALTSDAVEMPGDQSGRLELARWVASPDNPLTARVMVNRVWHWLFDKGLVETADNFGLRGAKPSHPELLDWLAVTFVEDGWSIKETIRRIVLSSTYQMSSRHDVAAARIDPENRLLWHQNRRRLEAEIIRDAMLAVSGRLDRTQFGKTLTYTGRLEGKGQKDLNSNPWRRRSVYLPRYREDKQLDIMHVFNAAHPALVTGVRASTTVPTQALYLMNSPFVTDQSKALAGRLLARDELDAKGRIDWLYRLALGRGPTDDELNADRMFLDEFRRATEQSESSEVSRQAWAALCHTMLASNEFLFVE